MLKSLLITIDFPPNLGGVAKYLSNICEYLPADKIVVLASEVKNNDFDKHRSYKIYRKKLLWRFLKPAWLPIFWQVFFVIKKEDIKQLCISHVLPVGYVALVFKKIFKIPFLVYVHGLDIKAPQYLPWKFYWLKKILQSSDTIIANSNYTKRELLNIGINENKIQVEYPCLNLRDLGEVNNKQVEFLRQKHQVQNKKIILTVGRLVQRKGQDMIIKALPKILEQEPDTIYLIAGEGEYKKSLQDLVEKYNLQEKVIFAGAVSKEELSNYYAVCDFFAMPARELSDGDIEGFGIVFLEAAYYGKTSIAGRSGGMAEAVQDKETGLVVNGADINDIAEKIILLLHDIEYRKKLSEKARQESEYFVCGQ